MSAAVADALYTAADHIPVFLELQLPAKLDAVAELAFGGVLTGATAEDMLTVGNAAASPAADLSILARGACWLHGARRSIRRRSGLRRTTTRYPSTRAASASSRATSRSLERPRRPDVVVALSATVLDHASPSLDEFAVDLDDTVDFGSHAAGAFADETLHVHNEGYDALQSLLDVYDVEIVGGDGRFSIVGGFSPQMVGDVPAEYDLTFDASGSPNNTLYEAVITFSTRDDTGNLGGVGLADAVIFTSAYVTDGTGIGDEVPALALSPGSPNPFTEQTTLGSRCPRPSDALIEVYDVSGRLVATLADGTLPAGSNRVVWDGRDSGGSPAASGIYFCRAAVGDWHEVRKVVLLR